jgi:hypothetical protein
LELFWAISRLFIQTFLSTPLHFIFWIVLLIIYSQYRRLLSVEKKLFGSPRTDVRQRLLHSLAYGTAGGFCASILLFLLGVSLTNIGVYFILPLALLLMLLKTRFLCFAYAGGLIALLAATLQLFPGVVALLEATFLKGLVTLHVPGLLSLVAVLHFTESILIRFSGHRHCSPVYVKTAAGKVVGGFNLQTFWPLPLVGLGLAAALQVPVTGETLAMPDWWPLLGTDWAALAGEDVVFLMLPLVAWLGYGDVALTSTPLEKVRRSSVALAGYSIVLMVLAFLSSYVSWLAFPAALFSPLGHELVIRLGNRRERAGEFLYGPVERGLRVLDTLPGSEARGVLEPGDVILSVTGEAVTTPPEFWAALQRYHPFSYLEVEKPGGRVARVRLSLTSRDFSTLGILLVPQDPPAYVELK